MHNARSNMNNHVGYNHHLSDIRNLALGTDGIGSDMFEEMKFAFFKHRDAGGPLWPDSFAKALTNGNELMSRNFWREIWSSGSRLQSRFNHLRLQLADAAAGNIAGHIAFGMGSGSVHSVMVNGAMVETKTVSSNFDCDSIYAQARKAAASMRRRMDALA
ncbi:amidohydrolase [Escherichia coli]